MLVVAIILLALAAALPAVQEFFAGWGPWLFLAIVVLAIIGGAGSGSEYQP